MEIVQRSVTEPGGTNPVIPEFGELVEEMVAVPLTTDHTPVPIVGVFPAKVAVVTQARFWFAPAAATVGAALLVIITSSKEAVHGGLEIVHLKVLAPTPRAVSPEVDDPGVVIVPEPPTRVHVPLPVPGVFPASVAVVAQIVWSDPAAAVVDVPLLVMITSSKDAVHGGLEIVHLNVLAPTPRAVSPEVADPGVVIVPEPPTRVHVPVPVTGVFPARTAVVAQIVWSDPAAAVVGAALFVMITSSKEDKHEP